MLTHLVSGACLLEVGRFTQLLQASQDANTDEFITDVDEGGELQHGEDVDESAAETDSSFSEGRPLLSLMGRVQGRR